jgi:adenylate kinase family enzyme
MMDRPRTFVLMGRSGCGKGTQAQLLERYLRRVDPARRVLRVTTGERFRRLAAGKKYTAGLVRAALAEGELLPPFLAIWNWAGDLVNRLRGPEHLIIDGTPRTRLEAEALADAIRFYGRGPATIILLDVSEAWSRKRLRERGRADDRDPGDIARRLGWFDSQVLPALKFFRALDEHEVITVPGEQTIEAVHESLVERL